MAYTRGLQTYKKCTVSDHRRIIRTDSKRPNYALMQLGFCCPHIDSNILSVGADRMFSNTNNRSIPSNLNRKGKCTFPS